MEEAIRPARAGDKARVAEFTADTFVWGDYVADVFDEWLAQPKTMVLVGVDTDDAPIALARAILLSPTEAWFSAARVHPDWRGQGVAGRLAAELKRWAGDEGAHVGRLLIEGGNEPSIRHVTKIGMRPVAAFARCERAVGDASPVPTGNGGRRVPAQERLRPTKSAEAEPAFMSWSVGELGTASRGLFGLGWTFRRLTTDDLIAAARHDALWEARSGWAMGARNDNAFGVGWVETRPEDAGDFLRAIVDVASDSGAESLSLWLPAVDWALRAARRAGCELHPMTVYATEI